MDRQKIYRRRRTRFWKRDKSAPPVKFYRTLAMFAGYCGICSTSYKECEPIYHCPKTETTASVRVHVNCYLDRMRAPKPTPTDPHVIRQYQAARRLPHC